MSTKLTPPGWLLIVPALLVACADRPVATGDSGPMCADQGQQRTIQVYRDPSGRAVDLLFVIDNSASLLEEHQNLAKNFPRLLEALHHPVFGAARIPDLHVGVITSDLGAGNYGLPSCETPGGDGGKLQSSQQMAGCTPPIQPFITYRAGETNVPSANADPMAQLAEGFQCIAQVKYGGCGFEHILESARHALDPKLNRNPGFVRKDALLAIVILTDEDDCSAQRTELFDPNDQSLGPLSSFRCFEHGVSCDINDRDVPGPREGCEPAFDWLYPVEEYVSFFRSLKDPGQILVFAIAGPAEPVEVKIEVGRPLLLPSCSQTMGKALPAIRIKAFTEGFGRDGYFNRGLEALLTRTMTTSACDWDYSPALRLVGNRIVNRLLGTCVGQPLTDACALACNRGDLLGAGATCATSCLEYASCEVREGPGWALDSAEWGDPVPRCPERLFQDPAERDLSGADVPCWRLTPGDHCVPMLDGSRYALEVVRRSSPALGSILRGTCLASVHAWGSTALMAEPRCDTEAR